MLKVYLVYHTQTDGGNGMGGGGGWDDPYMIGAFTTKDKARNCIRRERRKHKKDWRHKFSYKTLKVT